MKGIIVVENLSNTIKIFQCINLQTFHSVHALYIQLFTKLQEWVLSLHVVQD